MLMIIFKMEFVVNKSEFVKWRQGEFSLVK